MTTTEEDDDDEVVLVETFETVSVGERFERRRKKARKSKAKNTATTTPMGAATNHINEKSENKE
jgi:hypothetical protein